LSFFDDEGDEPITATRASRPAPRRPSGARRRGPDDRTLLIRRAGAALVAILVVVVIVLIVKTVIDNQATDALKTYLTKVNTLAGSESTARYDLFNQLDLAYNSANQIAVANDVQQEVQAVQTDYRTAQGWSVPSQMLPAQRELVSALGFRYQALRAIENTIPSALGTGDQTAAITQLAGDMELLLTSDVIYAERVAPLIQQALTTAGITTGTVTPSAFLPDTAWVIPQTVATRILGYVPVSLGGRPQTGSNGHELLDVTYGSGTALSTSASNTIALGAQGVTFVLTVKNSGTGIVHDVLTKVHFFARGVSTSCLDRTGSIPVTSPAGTYHSTIVVSPPASCTSFFHRALLMTAEVDPVPGETDTANNKQHFTVVFTPS